MRAAQRDVMQATQPQAHVDPPMSSDARRVPRTRAGTRTAITTRTTAVPPSTPSTPRLRLEPTGSRRTLLDGGWWPRSTDPVAELPGLVLAIDQRHGPVSRLVLSAAGWRDFPRRLAVGRRVLRLGYFASQPAHLLTALCDNGERVDLLVVPPETEGRLADAAMALAAATGNVIHAEHLLTAASSASATPVETGGQGRDVWEGEGGHLAPVTARRRP